MSLISPVRAALFAATISLGTATAEQPESASSYHFYARSQTHLLMFQSALAPGPGGAIVRTETRAPLVEYLNLNATRLDSPFGIDTGEAELSMWAGAQLADRGNADRIDGDVQTASVALSTTPGTRRAWVRFGRQVQAGGAARFARFDGASAAIAIVPELSFKVYGGFVVLPRWDRQPHYYYLGSAADSLQRDPEAFQDPQRDQYGVVGGRMSFDHKGVHAALSVHEQRDAGEAGRRNLGLDVGVPLTDFSYMGGALLVDVDSMRISTGRVFADVALREDWNFSGEYLKAEPALLLSRSSVLSVFSTSGYHETGGTVAYRPWTEFKVNAGGFVQFYDESSPGTRLDVGGRVLTSSSPKATILSFGYGRVDADGLGYHSGRLAASQPLPYDMTAVMQTFAYFYDEEIRGYDHSLTGSLSVAYPFASAWELLWAGTASQTPYASLDASTQLRLTYQLANDSGGQAW